MHIKLINFIANLLANQTSNVLLFRCTLYNIEYSVVLKSAILRMRCVDCPASGHVTCSDVSCVTVCEELRHRCPQAIDFPECSNVTGITPGRSVF